MGAIEDLPQLLAGPSSKRHNAAHAYLMSLESAESRRVMRSYLTKIAVLCGFADIASMPWAALNRELIYALRELLKRQNLAPNTIGTYLSAIRSVAREAWLNGDISADEYQRIRTIKRPGGRRVSTARSLTEAEASALLQSCLQEQDAKAIRDHAILSLMLGCGLRRTELVGLTYESTRWAQSEILVLGKGNKERLQPIPDDALSSLRRWVELIRGEYEGPLFYRIRRGGEVTGEGMTAQAIYHILQQRAQRSVQGKVSPHDLRRTFASRLLASGIDLLVVRDLLGHASVSTTQIYDHRGHAAKKDAIRRINLLGADSEC